MRIALGIEYDGHLFHGWQAQEGLNTIQGQLENALSIIAAEPIKVFCAGRTDAGVHATGQVVHFDTEAMRDARAWTVGTNTHLPPSIAVRWIREVDDQFHARFSAIARRYRYVIFNDTLRPAIHAARVTWNYRPLNVLHMQQAAEHLLGEHDFTSFRSSRCESKTPRREIQSLVVTRHQDLIAIEIQANAFLHHMVRNIAGLLMRVGAGFETPEWAATVLTARDRRAGAETASPNGLYLTQVYYPSPYLFPPNNTVILPT